MQKRLGRIRPPRVHITYDLETENSIVQKELPCIIGIIADLSGEFPSEKKSYHNRKFIFLDPENFPQVLRAINPTVSVPISIKDKKLDAQFSIYEMDDFKPIIFLNQIPELKDLYEQKIKLSDLNTRISNNSDLFNVANKIMENPSAEIDELLNNLKMNNKEYLKTLFDLFKVFLTDNKDNQILSPIIFINKCISDIHNMLSQCFDAILHDKNFQKLEGAWRGIHHLLVNSEISTGLKLRVLNANYDELSKDLNDALEFDKSFLFQKLYEEEYGSYGGHPYSYLIIDQHIEQNQSHFDFLLKLSQIVSCAHIPTSIGVHPSLFNLHSFEDIYKIYDVTKIFESPELAAFNAFRSTEDAKYISFVLPRFMNRLPYGPDTNPMQFYRETIENHEDFSWSNSVYVYAERVAASFSHSGWFSSLIGPMNGGLVENLPVYTMQDEDGDRVIKCPVEYAFTERKEREFSENGFMSLCYCKGTNYSAFFSGHSAYKPLHYEKSIANANANLSGRFQYMLNTSRFVHYICCMMRDHIGTFSTSSSIEGTLNTWISQYVLSNAEEFPDLLYKYPLKKATVKVEEDESSPGKYRAIIYLQPHYQMEELTISLRLVARIPMLGAK